ncbi:glycosyltransferase family 9 protein [Nocardioides sp. URHA0020]|uniref:glycosyltransferase family 9 protein n=1 Tax=Nocardioides sp. URHA0020 TaxID=1380392 RepID=UPI00068470AC|nr:glycosyltransferase family 9 protein [Nocardioides sp. URHA0020]
MSPRALVLRAIGLGDYLAGVPALRALRRALPAHELVLAAPPALAPLVRLTDAVDRLLPTRELQPVPWRGRPPEVAVDLHGNGPASKRLLQELHPGRLVAFAGPGGGGEPVAGPGWRADEHERSRWCRLVTEAFDVAADPDDVGIAAPTEPASVTAAVLVHVGAASESRRWPEERFARAAAWARARGETVVLTGTSAERARAERVAGAAGLPSSAVLAGRTDLQELAATVASARLVVSGDTGVAHLASALATPSVVLFGPVSPATWGPPVDGPHTVVWHGDGTGDPHGAVVDPALLAITVDEVVAAMECRLPAVGRRSSATHRARTA